MRRGIILYQEYQSVCTFVGIGSPRPLTRKRGNTRLRVGGANSDDLRESLWHSVYFVALCLSSFIPEDKEGDLLILLTEKRMVTIVKGGGSTGMQSLG